MYTIGLTAYGTGGILPVHRNKSEPDYKYFTVL